MNPKMIVIDGKTYNSVEEMPPDVRQKYEQAMRSLGDANRNHVPDAFEGANIFADQDKDGIPDAFENLAAQNTAVSSMKIVIDGKEFNRVEDLPPDARARYEEAMGKMDANRNGIPDFVESMFTSSNQSIGVSSSAIPEKSYRSAKAPLPAPSAITPDTSNGWMLVLAGLFILFLCVAGAGAIWYFFLR